MRSARTVDESSREVRLLAMSDARFVDTLLLDSALADVEPSPAARQRRARAALLIGQAHVRSRFAVARGLLADADTSVAASAAFALGLERDTASLEALTVALRTAPDGVAAEAAWALGRIGEPARAALESALDDASRVPPGTDRREASLVSAMLFAASTLRPVPVDRIVPWLRDDTPDIAFAAAYAITRPRAVDGARAVLGHAGHAHADVRVQVALAAAENMAGDSLSALAVATLRPMLSDPSAAVRVQAVRSLATHAARVDVHDALLALSRDDVAAVRVTVAESAGLLVARDSARWQTLFNEDTTFMVRRALLDGALRRQMLWHELRRWQQHPDPWVRTAALELSALGPDSSAPLVRTAWARRDADPRVRAAAISALAAAGSDAAVRDTILVALQDAAPRVRAAALGALARTARAPDAERARQMIDAERRTWAQEQRLQPLAESRALESAGLRLLASAWRRDSLGFDDSLRARLARLTPAQDPLRRASVSTVTPLAHWNTPVATTGDLAHYARVLNRWPSSDPLPRAILRTVQGDITLELLAPDAPLTVDNFVELARQGWFRDSRFHRVIPNFVAQDGDPTGTGSGGPGTSIRDELNRHRYARGAVGMALSGPDTGGSQYFLTLFPQPHLDGGYTVFARVVSGFAAMDALLNGDRILDVVLP